MIAPEDSNAPTGATPLDAQRPWPGLLAFAEADRAFFFGRDAEADELIVHVVHHRVTLLFGRSGLGKTSLLNAGLCPRVRDREFFPVRVRLLMDADAPSPSSQLLSALAREMTQSDIEAPAARPDETIWEYLHRAGMECWSARNHLVEPVFVIDQFEEVFSRPGPDAAGQARRAAVLETIGDLVEGRVPAALKRSLLQAPERAGEFDFATHRYRVLIALREDYLADFEEEAADMPSARMSRIRLGPMRASTATTAVLAAGQQGNLVTPDVAAQIVAFVGASTVPGVRSAGTDAPIEPALLSVVCRGLNEVRLRDGRSAITVAQLETSADILRRFYEEAVADVPGALNRFLEDRFVTTDGIREMVAYQTLAAVPGVDEPSIARLIDRRILHIDYREGRRLLELTHDRLAPVVREARDRRAQQQAAEHGAASLLAAHRRHRLRQGAIALLTMVVVVALGHQVLLPRLLSSAVAAAASRMDLAFDARQWSARWSSVTASTVTVRQASNGIELLAADEVTFSLSPADGVSIGRWVHRIDARRPVVTISQHLGKWDWAPVTLMAGVAVPDVSLDDGHVALREEGPSARTIRFDDVNVALAGDFVLGPNGVPRRFQITGRIGSGTVSAVGTTRATQFEATAYLENVPLAAAVAGDASAVPLDSRLTGRLKIDSQQAGIRCESQVMLLGPTSQSMDLCGALALPQGR